MVQSEYLVKVGDLFVSNFFGNVGSVHFSDRQHESERYDKEKMAKVTAWLNERNVAIEVYRIDSDVIKVQSIELEVTEVV